METINTPPASSTRPGRKVNWFLVAIIILLLAVSAVQGIMLLKSRQSSRDWSPGKMLRSRSQESRPDQARAVARDNPVILWEHTDDLEQIHAQINRLFQDMALTFGPSMHNGFFPDFAMPRLRNRDAGSMLRANNDFSDLQQEIERIFTEACDESRQGNVLSRVERGWDTVPSVMAMNIEDQGSNYVVAVALPGYSKENITIALEGRLLTIEAKQPVRAQSRAARPAIFAQHGRAHTRVMLPEDSEGADAKASFEDNVLRVQIPKTEKTNSLVRSIAIR